MGWMLLKPLRCHQGSTAGQGDWPWGTGPRGHPWVSRLQYSGHASLVLQSPGRAPTPTLTAWSLFRKSQPPGSGQGQPIGRRCVGLSGASSGILSRDSKLAGTPTATRHFLASTEREGAHLRLSLLASSSRICTACRWYSSWASTRAESWLTCSICKQPVRAEQGAPL